MTTELTLSVVSATAGMITASDALVEMSCTTSDAQPALRLNRAGVTDHFVELQPGHWRGLVTGFIPGENVLDAETGFERVRCTVTRAPVEGPLFSGPHLKPWRTTTAENGLGAAVDEHGNASSRIDFHFMNAATGEFESYDPDAPPPAAQIATTTTDRGVTLPYIVRREVGAADRGIYEFAVLCDPGRSWTAIAPQPGWNRKLWVYSYGGWNQFWSQSVFGLGQADPGRDAAPRSAGDLANDVAINAAAFDALPKATVLDDMGLRRGFMVARTTFMQSASNSDSVRAAESLVMLKEHITKRYGPIRYTLASGASGGSIMQQMIANQYPGIFQGIIPMSSFQGTWYLENTVIESRLLERYFTQTSPQLWADVAQRLAVDGHRTEEFRAIIVNVFVGLNAAGDPTRGTNLPGDQTYHSQTNPGGARATLQDYQVNYLGTRPREQWTNPEAAIGRGFAHLPYDNVGVQYGLQALLDDTITVEQFLDLNDKIGGVDIDGHLVAHRHAAAPAAIANLHRTGLLNDFANMDDVAILDFRPPETEEFVKSHTQFHTWVARAALTAAHGHADNQVAWIVPGFAALAPTDAAFETMDRWLAAIEADTSDRPLSRKVVANKPAELVDGVFDVDGNQIGDLEYLHRTYPSYGDARSVAARGDYRVFGIGQPHLTPLARDDYPGVPFTDSQWQRLHQIFPDGVADWAQAGNNQTPSLPWLTYADGPGGQPLQPGDVGATLMSQNHAVRDA